MNTQQIASAILQMIPNVNIAATLENAQVVIEIHQTLAAMARGELVLSPPTAPEKASAPPQA